MLNKIHLLYTLNSYLINSRNEYDKQLMILRYNAELKKTEALIQWYNMDSMQKLYDKLKDYEKRINTALRKVFINEMLIGTIIANIDIFIEIMSKFRRKPEDRDDIKLYPPNTVVIVFPDGIQSYGWSVEITKRDMFYLTDIFGWDISTKKQDIGLCW